MGENTRSITNEKYIEHVTNEEKRMLLQPIKKEKQPNYIPLLALPLVALSYLIYTLT